MRMAIINYILNYNNYKSVRHNLKALEQMKLISVLHQEEHKERAHDDKLCVHSRQNIWYVHIWVLPATKSPHPLFANK